uniref:Uncharacterized protein n=1 Tax=Molossus molossus TaxID=27622 RepID=A0A7J8HH37_MOLMO|nr:hypothetical protein HJG59_010982 [Molossus molossus]
MDGVNGRLIQVVMAGNLHDFLAIFYHMQEFHLLLVQGTPTIALSVVFQNRDPLSYLLQKIILQISARVGEGSCLTDHSKGEYTFLISFYCQIIFYCGYIPHVVHSSVDEHLGCFHFLAVLNNAAVNIPV